MIRTPIRFLALALGACVLASASCQIGPQAMKMGHPQYAAAIKNVRDEEMLLNLVRLRYRATPVWLNISSISTQFEMSASADADATINEDVGSSGKNADEFGLEFGMRYSERPTITYTILGGEQFIKRMLAPIPVFSVSLLMESGWRADRVLRVTVERMNGLENAPRASGPTPENAPVYADFRDAARLIRKLDWAREIDFVYETRVEAVSRPLPADKLSAGDVINAAKASTIFEPSDQADGEPAKVVLTMPKRVVVMRFRRSGSESGDAVRLRELLALEEGLLRADLVEAENGEYDPLDASGPVKNIGIDTRSFMGILYFLSNAVDVPAEHEYAGPVTVTLDEAGNLFDWSEVLENIFVVHHSERNPEKAAVAVPYRGVWYYIAYDDEETLATFSLLHQLASIVAGDVPQAAPVLTLPIGG